MKKIIALFMVTIMVLGFTACGEAEHTAKKEGFKDSESISSSEKSSSNDTSEDFQSVSSSEPATSTDSSNDTPSINSSKHSASTESSNDTPSVNSSKHSASTESSKDTPSVNNSQNSSSSSKNENTSSTTSSSTGSNANDNKPPVYNIPKLSKKVKDLPSATVKTFNDSVTQEKQVNTYTYKPARDGRYTFEISEMKSGVYLGVSIFDRLGKEVEDHDYIANGDFIYIDLEGGETYTCKIYQQKEFGSYILNIHEQTATANISAYSAVNDSINFKKQINVYTFVPELDGRYTFEISEMKSGRYVSLGIYDRLEEEIKKSDYVQNGVNSIVVDLKKGETYTVRVYQNKEFSSYTLNIWKQKPVVDIVVTGIVNDSIEFYKQNNLYTFTATGKTHSIEVSNLAKGIVLEVYILNYLEESVGEDSYCVNGNTIKMNNLTAGKQYTIQIIYQKNYGDYTVTLK